MSEPHWTRFSGEGLFESLINNYAFDIVDEASFRKWLADEKGIQYPDAIPDEEADRLLEMFKDWARFEPDWVGAYSAHRGYAE